MANLQIPKWLCCKKGVFGLKSALVRENLNNFEKNQDFCKLVLDFSDGGDRIGIYVDRSFWFMAY